MARVTLALLTVLLTVGCTSTEAARQTAEEAPPSQADVAELRAEVNRLSNKLGHLESEFVASQADGEFTKFTIDRLYWPSDLGREPEADGSGEWRTVYCHVVEWNGFGRMKRFTRMADSMFFLDAPGRESLHGYMAEGGISDAEGSVRLTVLSVSSPLEPGVEYTLRPRNNVEGYQWAVADHLVVQASTKNGH